MTDFDATPFHPQAAEALDRAGEALVDLFVVKPPWEGATEPFPTRFEVETVRSLSIEPVSALVDFAQRTVGWAIYTPGQEYILKGDGYRTLRQRVELLRRKPPFRDGFSDHFLEKTIADWCAEQLQGESPGRLSSYLLAKSAAVFVEQVCLVPLSNIEIERDFPLGTVRIVTIDPARFTATRDHARGQRPDDPEAGKSADGLAKDFANCTAVEVRISGEPRFVRSRALAVAHDAAGVLRFLSPAPAAISVPCAVQPFGFSPLPRSTLFKVRDGRITKVEHEILHAGLAGWKLSARDIDRLTTGPLANLQRLFDERDDTPYVAHVRRAFFAYCRALGRFEIADRLVDTISALEALLLGGTDGPLQIVVAERLAFISANSAEDRIRIIKDYKRAYAMRSTAVHHLGGIDDEEVADRLLGHAFITFFKAIEGMSHFNSPAELFDGLDLIKFSGTYRSAKPGDGDDAGAPPPQDSVVGGEYPHQPRHE